MGNYTVSFYDREMNRRFFRHFQNVSVQNYENYIQINDENNNLLMLVSVNANTVIVESDGAYLTGEEQK